VWTDASRQFTTDGILVIAGDFWVGGLDEYAAAATEVLNAPLPSDASARDRRERLLGILLASLGFKVEQRNVATALYLRWLPNPKYAGAIDFNWQPESDGRMSIRLQATGA